MKLVVLTKLLSNKVLITSLLGWLIAQILKVIVVFFKEKRLDMRRMVGSGGMPSSHASFVMALVTAVGFSCGVDSVEFAISVVLAFVVMYDATGVRREAGRQAEILNDIIENFGQDSSEIMGKRLKELIGHTPIQVFVGAVLGVLIGLFMYLCI
ncbi:MAG: divergent PAP2 family protein [Ruminococcaceae bacterium]|nr:divergent PAP2 family protein [Oscillospiraceae bacterium]